METIEYKKKHPGLASTIVVGIFITVFLLTVFVLLRMNLKETMEAYQASAQESSGEHENVGEISIVINLLYAGGALAIIFIHYFMALAPLLVCPVLLISSISNIKKDNKIIKIFNIVYLSLLALIVTACVIKFILFVTHAG